MKFVTLGPSISCHENALIHYLRYHEISNASIFLIDDFLWGLEMVKQGEADYLLQCSAHPDVHLVTEKYPREVFVTDTFIYPTREMAILEKASVTEPQTLGLPKATEGYLCDITYPNYVYETTKTVVGKNLLAGKYDAGLTYYEFHKEHPGHFRVRKHIGHVLTTWLLYGKKNIFTGSVLGALPKGFFQDNRFL